MTNHPHRQRPTPELAQGFIVADPHMAPIRAAYARPVNSVPMVPAIFECACGRTAPLTPRPLVRGGRCHAPAMCVPLNRSGAQS